MRLSETFFVSSSKCRFDDTKRICINDDLEACESIFK